MGYVTYPSPSSLNNGMAAYRIARRQLDAERHSVRKNTEPSTPE